MRWQGRRGSGNVVDRRAGAAGALGGTGVILAILYFLFTGDPSVMTQPPRSDVGAAGERGGGEEEQVGFVRVVLADTEDVWNSLFPQLGRSYVEPKLVLFNGQVNSACGMASAAVGPFYCPRDQQVYIDLDFFTALETRLGAGGDFAQAYVIAHEVGHHVQNLMGLMQGRPTGEESVAVELQADCLAGVWAVQTEREKGVLEAGDLEEAVGAAEAVGDDRLQMRSQGFVVPDSFTHGTSAQRVAAFKRGFEHGDARACEF